VDVVIVDSQPQVINPNGMSSSLVAMLTTGATNYMGKIAFMGEGQGDNIAPAIYVMEPTAPYNTTGESLRLVFVRPRIWLINSDPE
jgi:gluconolactonase